MLALVYALAIRYFNYFYARGYFLSAFYTRLQSAVARGIAPFLLAVLCLGLLVSPARGDDEELSSLQLYNGAQTEIVSASRSPRPASQAAENITVVTAREIEALNAHTLTDILAVVTGIQLEMVRTPGTVVNMELQGSGFNHVLVLIDNIPFNNLADNYADISSIPVQMIERVEIVKGAASTSWGSALGGVVNVITKTPLAERPWAGMLSGSLGEKTTADTRAELSGTVNSLGYYLTGGNLRSDGLLANNMVDNYSVYGKLRYELPGRGALTLSSLYTDGSSGQVAFEQRDTKFNQQGHQLLSTLSLHYPLAERLLLEAAVRTRLSTTELTAATMSDDTVLKRTESEDSSSGGSLTLSWLSELQRVVAGVDFDHAKVHLSMPLREVDLLKRSANRVGVYLNDTFTLGDFAVTPSARYDHTGTEDDLFSPSLGVTYALTEESVLRGYTSRGYSLTSLNRLDSTEKVWTSQLGFETGDIPYLWLKGTFFRNDTWNLRSDTGTEKQRQLKHGYEVEARTLPLLNTSLSAGYTFIHATDDATGDVLDGVPRNTVNAGIRYQDRRNFRALLTGRYIDWNGHRQNGKYDGVVWDLHLAKELQLSEQVSLELFLSVRNILDADQYVSEIYKNAGRWGEVGVRCNF